MRKTRTEKGITLVALIITIIVLLILAVVAINAVQDDGIIEYAKNAKNEYEKAQANESALLENYINYIKENVVTVEKIQFSINPFVAGGDIEYYEAEKGMTWEQWVDSEYNLDNNGNKIYEVKGNNIGKGSFTITKEFINYVLKSDVIESVEYVLNDGTIN